MARIVDSLLIRTALLASAAGLVGCFEVPEEEPTDTDASTGSDTTSATTDPNTTAPGTDTAMESSGEPPADSTDGSTGEPGTDSSGTPAACGDGTVDDGELCDDGNTDDGDGCSASCEVDTGWDCDGASPTVCTTVCGDGVVGEPVEQCDDTNKIDTDDCTNACQNATCGDGVIWMDNEMCDDSGTDVGDGCSDTCEWEAGFVCDGAPSECFRAAFMADGAQQNSGSLWAMSLDGATTVELGVLTVGLTGLAFHPNGTLYGVTTTDGGGGGPVAAPAEGANNLAGSPAALGGFGGGSSTLGRIDLSTLEFIPIGSLVQASGETAANMPDITFMGDQLMGWSENGDDLAMIDSATALTTLIDSDRSSFGTAIGYNSATGDIVLAPNGSGGMLFLIDDMGGVTEGPSIMGVNGNVRGMSYFGGVFYGMDIGFGGKGGGGPTNGNLVTYDPATGTTTVLGELPTNSLDSLAVYDPANTP